MIHACVNLSPNIRARSLEPHVHADCIILHSFIPFFFLFILNIATQIPLRKWIQTWNKTQNHSFLFLSFVKPHLPSINAHIQLLHVRRVGRTERFKQVAWGCLVQSLKSRWDRRVTFDPQRKRGGNQREFCPLRVSVLQRLRAEQRDRSGACTLSMP